MFDIVTVNQHYYYITLISYLPIVMKIMIMVTVMIVMLMAKAMVVAMIYL